MTVAEEIRAEEKLRERLRELSGQWVAVRKHKLIAHAATLESLLEDVDGAAQDIEIFQVPQDSTAACFY